MRAIALAVVLAGWPSAQAEVRTLTLKQALDLALQQSPEALLSRLDERRAEQRVRIARDPFSPKVFAGSGLAYTSGFPMSIEGSAPSIVQTRAAASIYNLPQKYALAQAKEEARTTSLDAQGRRERALSETIALFLDAERLGKASAAAGSQLESAERTAQAVLARVQEGRELAVEGKRAALEVARARQRRDAFAADAEQAEMSLAAALGLNPGDRARPAGEDRMPPELPAGADAAASQALKDNREIRALESALLAKSLQVKSHQAERWPKLDLVAQYALFGRFNNYEDFFRRFERHNGQLGVSIQAPLLLGPAANAQAAIAEAEAAKLRIDVNRARRRITLDAQAAYLEVSKAESARQVARLDLEVAREDVSVALARMEEGRAAMTHVEAARRVENEKWLAYLQTSYSLERARFSLIERTGGLLALAGR
jgi:outer membrane protein